MVFGRASEVPSRFQSGTPSVFVLKSGGGGQGHLLTMCSGACYTSREHYDSTCTCVGIYCI